VAYALVIVVALLNVASVTLFKTGVARAGGIFITDLFHPLVMAQKFLTSPLLIVGVFTSICTNLLWLVTLTRLAANVALPLMNGIFYIALLTISVLFLGEEITVRKLLAVIAILLGVLLLVR